MRRAALEGLPHPLGNIDDKPQLLLLNLWADRIALRDRGELPWSTKKAPLARKPIPFRAQTIVGYNSRAKG